MSTTVWYGGRRVGYVTETGEVHLWKDLEMPAYGSSPKHLVLVKKAIPDMGFYIYQTITSERTPRTILLEVADGREVYRFQSGTVMPGHDFSDASAPRPQ